MMPDRVFADSLAVRGNMPIHVGITAPSGGGKTCSLLRIGTGMQRVIGGEIWGIDTEANRMLHYADSWKFRHVPFVAPFDPLSYLAAVEYCAKKGAKIIIIDSASHMHEGPGGTLEQHEAECERLMKAWGATRDKVQMAAWQRPKSDLRRFLNSVLQMPINILWAFRAKEKIKIVSGQQPKPLGFMPIAGDEMIYEMTLNCLLYPNSGGVPSWHPEEMGERAIIKLPQQFKALFEQPKPLDEDIGEALAKWAAGGVPVHATAGLSVEEVEKYVDLIGNSTTLTELQAAYASAQEAGKKAKDRAALDRFAKVKDLTKEALAAIP